MEFHVVFHYWPVILEGLKTTVLVTLGSLVLSMFLSIPLALMKLSKNKLLSGFGFIYTDIFRSLPSLVQIYLVYFAAPQLLGITFSASLSAYITLSMNAAAYISEALRGGIQSVDMGQREAARALGVSEWDMTKDIILPQALKTVFPVMVNESIGLLKGTSLVSIIGVVDLMRAGQQIMADTYLAFEPLMTIAAIYYVLVKGISILGKHLENRMKLNERN
jgi:His/Glu/Gln/Arg/opine family amino acid ABC transporter permease subunit